MQTSVAQISIFLLAIGVVFGIGETLALEFSYFNSSSYIDFLTKSVKGAPILTIPILVYAIFARFILSPHTPEKGKNFIPISDNEEAANRDPNQTRRQTFFEEITQAFQNTFLDVRGQILSLFLVAAWGFVTIAGQNHHTADAVVYLKDTGAEDFKLKGNLLATNSAAVALYSDNKLYVIPLSNVDRIQYEKSNYVFIRKIMKFCICTNG